MWTDDLKVGDTVYIQSGWVRHDELEQYEKDRYFEYKKDGYFEYFEYFKTKVTRITKTLIVCEHENKFYKKTGYSSPYFPGERIVETTPHVINTFVKQELAKTLLKNIKYENLMRLETEQINQMLDMLINTEQGDSNVDR